MQEQNEPAPQIGTGEGPAEEKGTAGRMTGSASANHSASLSQSTGPRTPAGKERSKRNAIKSGIFSKVALLPSESRSELASLLNGFRRDLQPEGTVENVLVDKLAVLSWRYRRLVIAETAEIQKGATFLEWDERERQEKEANETSTETLGLIHAKENPQILKRCLQLLGELKDRIERNGFNSEGDEAILTKFYGNGERPTKTLVDTYLVYNCTAQLSDEERKQYGYPSPEECRRGFLWELDDEIRRLSRYKKARSSIQAERMRLESLRRNVPDSPQLDRLLRYETSLERAFYRAFTELERIQRLRLGQPVPPPLKVNVSMEPSGIQAE